MRDERVERVEEDLVDEVEADGAVVVLPRLDGDVPHLAPPQERQAVVTDEGLEVTSRGRRVNACVGRH